MSFDIAWIMLIQQLATWTATFVLMLLLPRYLGPVDFGRLYLAMSVAAICQIVVNFGASYSILNMLRVHKRIRHRLS